ncbi:MAG: hypothetical protein Kow0099_22050 [Candidatus Abyssubacteria bacterium]
MDRKRLLKKRKSELLEMLEESGVRADPNARKDNLINALMALETGPQPTPPSEEEPGQMRPAREQVEETKYSTELHMPGSPVEAQPRYPTTLPHRYGEDRIVAMTRDPYWIFAYWEVTPEALQRAREELGPDGESSRMTIRVYDITATAFDGGNANYHFDIDVGADADNWYINTGQPNRSYCIDIGLLSPSGVYKTIARSNPVHAPRASASEEVDERWMSLEQEFERMYALSGGFQIGTGSLELKEMMEKQLRMQLASEAPASLFSMQAPRKERGFWFVLNAELILYGATVPGAEVTMQGTRVQLRPDGTFSARFSLPDGEYVIPVTARSPDGLEERTITPTVTRTTRAGEPVIKE